MWINTMLVLVLMICVITDLKNRKIYNKVIFPSLLVAITSHVVLSGWDGFWMSLLGFFTGLGLLLIPYLLGGMGAGDVKLLALIGALKGTVFVFHTALYMGILGGIMAVIILLFRKGVTQRFYFLLLFLMGRRYGLKMPLLISKDTLKTTYPYGVAIGGGAVICLVNQGGLFLW